MSTVNIIPKNLEGEVVIPPSKSLAHRAIIAAGLSSGISEISNISYSEDIAATINAMKSLGAGIKKKTAGKDSNSLLISGTDNRILPVEEIIRCNESGSTLRFTIPLAGLTDRKLTFQGKGRLTRRPLTVYYDIFDNQGIEYYTDNGRLPLTVPGRIKPGRFVIKGNISSQFITGLMFSLPLLNGDSRIIITTDLESRGYVDLTINILKKYSIEINNNNYQEFFIRGRQRYRPNNYRVEGDYSQAAFWIAAGVFGNRIKCSDIKQGSLQADRRIVNTVDRMGADLNIERDSIIANRSNTYGIKFDASQCPDLVPIVAVLAALSAGKTEIINAARLRIKESDRLKAVSTELNKLGADIRELKDGLVIRGKKQLNGGVVDSWNDHRIAMSLAVAAIKCTEPVIIKNSHAVKKSYPDFWGEYRRLGGNIDEWN